MSNEGLYTSGSTAVSAKVDSIPLRDTYATQPGNDSIGTLISNASEQVSTLVRGEIELAKAEVIGEVKKGAVGGGLFAAAGVIALYSSFFLFFALAEMLASWMHRGWAFLIVFLIMLALAGLLAFVGFRKIKKIKAPEKTIESVNELKNLKPGQAQKNLAKDESGLYTSAGAGSTAVTR
ncbi:phage holin family protein [Corynebacterium mucifaciens]|nr:phage holin family protein [Corynebacterium mucifaciens]